MNGFRKTGRALTLFGATLAMLTSGCSGGGSGQKTDRDVQVGIVSGPTTEGGEQATFTVVLQAKPSADVTIPMSSSNEGEGTVSPASLTFTKANWNAPQTVTLTGVDDAVADGNQVFYVEFGEIETTDGVYGFFELAPVAVTNLDDETAGVRISQPSGPTSEWGDQATIDVRLQSQPSADVLLIFGTSDLGEGTSDVQTLTFTAANWNAPQTVTVTGLDDDVADGNKSYQILFQFAASEDPAYGGLEIPSVSLVNLDDDIAAVVVSPSHGITSETGTQTEVSVVLTAAPAGSVTVSNTLSDSSEATRTPTSVSFTASNWDVPKTITITGSSDGIEDGDQPYALNFTVISGQDAAYDGLAVSPVSLLNLDVDSAGILVSPFSGATAESGAQATFAVRLKTKPTSTVDIGLSIDDSTEATVSPSTLTFTTSDFSSAGWSSDHFVTVTGKVDFMRDGHQPFSVVFAPAVSSDATYSGMTAPNHTNYNIDDGPIRTALVFDDGGATLAASASMARGYEAVVVDNTSDFDTEFDGTEIEFIVWESTSTAIPVGTESRLAAWASSGGRLVLSHWDLANAGALQSALDVTAMPYAGNNTVRPVSGVNPNFFDFEHSFLSPLAADNTTNWSALSVSTNGTLAALLDSSSGPGGIAVTNSSGTIVNGFLPDSAAAVDSDSDGLFDVQELYENQIASFYKRRGNMNSPTAIPALTTIESSIMIPAPSTKQIKKVTLSMHITHPTAGDIDAFLISPDGTRVEIVTDIGFSGDDFGTSCADSDRTAFDQSAGQVIPNASASAPFVGTWQPEGNLNDFIGLSPNGLWTFEITDDAGSSTSGTLECWSLIIEY